MFEYNKYNLYTCVLEPSANSIFSAIAIYYCVRMLFYEHKKMCVI